MNVAPHALPDALRASRPGRQGLTLIEVLIAAVILAIAGVAVLAIFSGSAKGIQTTDLRREERFFLNAINAHVNRVSLHTLWDHYGPAGVGPERKLGGALALVDGEGKLTAPDDPESNPLGFTQDFLTDLQGAGLSARIDFDFYTRAELNYDPEGNPHPELGLLHMQAGYATLYLFARKDGADPGAPPPDPASERWQAAWRQPIMCPAIVGRPGLKLSSCPAVAPPVKCRYGPLLAAKEGFEWTRKDQEDCDLVSDFLSALSGSPGSTD